MTTLKKPNSRIIRIAEDNYLVLLDQSFNGEHLLEVLTKLIPDHETIKSRDSIFIDVGTLIKCTDCEMLIAIASLKLFIEGPVIHIQIDFLEPLTGKKLKTEKDQFINSSETLPDAIVDIAVMLIEPIDAYKKVVTYGC